MNEPREQAHATRQSRIAYGASAGGVVLPHADSKVAIGREPRDRVRAEALEELTLNPAATRSQGAGNRPIPEAPDPHRTCFERDLDRIKHSRAFRRLNHKAQVFINAADDHLRTRLTHAIEVAQVATAISRRCGLNLALTEAAALAHDCGHGPAGHASEEAFDSYLDGGFDHATWGAEMIATPLNLCVETIDAIACHSWRLPAPSTPEGEVVSLADRIAYLAHDYDDAINAGIIARGDLPDAVADLAGHDQSTQIATFVGGVCDAVATTGQLGLPAAHAASLRSFREFMYERVYLRPAAVAQAERVIVMLRGLVEYYTDAPGKIVDGGDGHIPHPTSGSADACLRAVGYVSGMTDRFAIAQAVELLGWDPARLPRGA